MRYIKNVVSVVGITLFLSHAESFPRNIYTVLIICTL